GHVAFEAREVREQPRDEDDAQVEDAQARVVETTRDSVDLPRQLALVSPRLSYRTVDVVRRECGSIHVSLLLALATRGGRAADRTPPPRNDARERAPDQRSDTA